MSLTCARGDVDLERKRLAAFAVDLIGGLARTGLIDVGAHDVGALAGKNKRRGAANAAPGASDDDGFSGEVVRRLRHVSPRFLWGDCASPPGRSQPAAAAGLCREQVLGA
jgi:hypothetical protein